MKAHRRGVALAMSRNRMMADVAEADVLLVNPTHVAVALKYDPEKGAPRVVAKGAGEVAARLRAIAAENRVPMVQDIPLARALHASCDLGQEVPAPAVHRRRPGAGLRHAPRRPRREAAASTGPASSRRRPKDLPEGRTPPIA